MIRCAPVARRRNAFAPGQRDEVVPKQWYQRIGRRERVLKASADQQSGAHITGAYAMPANWLSTCKSGCTQFEATRNHWAQMPAAVQKLSITPEGFVRVTARADNHLVLGIAAVGAGVSELAGAFGLALEMGARLEDIGGTIHAHPTLGEAFHEASLRALGEALHI